MNGFEIFGAKMKNVQALIALKWGIEVESARAVCAVMQAHRPGSTTPNISK